MKGKQNQIVNLPTRTYEALTSKLLSDSSYLNRYTAKQVAKELGYIVNIIVNHSRYI